LANYQEQKRQGLIYRRKKAKANHSELCSPNQCANWDQEKILKPTLEPPALAEAQRRNFHFVH